MSKKNKAFVFAGPRLLDTDFLKNIDFEDSLIIAADCGMKNLKAAGVSPDVIIGDFDSEKKPETEPQCAEILTYPVEKDDTDTMLCLRYALDVGVKDITIISGVGGRLDHTIANIQSLGFLLSNGALGRIISSDTEIYLLRQGEHIFKKKSGFSLSLFSYSERVEGLSIKGAKYEVCGIDIDNSFPIGVSNKVLSDEAEVSFESGVLLVVISRL